MSLCDQRKADRRVPVFALRLPVYKLLLLLHHELLLLRILLIRQRLLLMRQRLLLILQQLSLLLRMLLLPSIVRWPVSTASVLPGPRCLAAIHRTRDVDRHRTGCVLPILPVPAHVAPDVKRHWSIA